MPRKVLVADIGLGHALALKLLVVPLLLLGGALLEEGALVLQLVQRARVALVVEHDAVARAALPGGGHGLLALPLLQLPLGHLLLGGHLERRHVHPAVLLLVSQGVVRALEREELAIVVLCAAAIHQGAGRRLFVVVVVIVVVVVVIAGALAGQHLVVVIAQYGLVLAPDEAVVPGSHLGGIVVRRLGLVRARRLGALGTLCGPLLLLHVLDELHLGGARQAERGGELVQRERRHVERVFLLVQVDGAYVGDERLLCEVLELRVVERKRLDLVLHALHLGHARLDGQDRHLDVQERLEHALLLARQEEQEALAVRLVACGAADAVDVRVRAVRRVHLDDPVHRREVEPACSNVCGEECGVLAPGIVAEDLEPPHLFLLAVERHERHTGPQLAEHLVHKLHLAAGAHENEHLALRVGAQEGEEHVQLPVERDDHEELLELPRRARLGVVLAHRDELGVLEAQPRKVLYPAGLRRGEEQRLPLLGQVLEDGVERVGEAHVQDPVRLVEHEQLEPRALKAHCLVQVLQQAAGRRHQHVHPHQALLLVLDVLPADHQARGKRVRAADLAQHLKYLDRQLPCGRDHQRAQAVGGRPAVPEECLEHGNQERERLA